MLRSVDELLSLRGEMRMYYSGTIGEAATAHWETEAILAEVFPLPRHSHP